MKGACHHVHGPPLPSIETRSLAVLSSTQRRRLLIAAKASRSSKPAASASVCVSTTAFRCFTADPGKVEDPEGSSSCLPSPSRPGSFDSGGTGDDTDYGMTLAECRNCCDSHSARVGQDGLFECQSTPQRPRLSQRGGRRPPCCSSMMQDPTRSVSTIALMTVRERVEHDARQRRLERHAAKRRQEDQTLGHITP